MKIVEFNGISHAFDETTTILQDLSLSIEEQAFHCITGPSGSGKTTLLNLLLGLLRPTHGEIFVNQCNICSLAEPQIAAYRQHIGTVFQHNNLIPHRSVYENVALPLWLRGLRDKAIRIQVQEYLERVGMAGFEDELPPHLSSGDQQRVAIARALIARPKIMVADEPTGNLDKLLALSVAELLKHQTSIGMTVITVTHDENVAALADTVSRLEPHAQESGASTFL
ncbi:MAG: ATP-binding cassette domain-containing protein [Gammaproteobacteria bacterium]|nr:ATP-binding cassette domain-containing protein [Gammaproteobacteria bacterium]